MFIHSNHTTQGRQLQNRNLAAHETLVPVFGTIPATRKPKGREVKENWTKSLLILALGGVGLTVSIMMAKEGYYVAVPATILAFIVAVLCDES